MICHVIFTNMSWYSTTAVMALQNSLILHTHKYTLTHTYTSTHTLSHTHTLKRSHTHMLTHTHSHTHTHTPFGELLTLSLDIVCSSVKVGVAVSLPTVSTSFASSADWAVSEWRRERWWAWLDGEGSKSIGYVSIH